MSVTSTPDGSDERARPYDDAGSTDLASILGNRGDKDIVTAIIKPGNTLVIGINRIMSDAQGEECKKVIENDLPGVHVVVIAPVVDMAIYPGVAGSSHRTASGS